MIAQNRQLDDLDMLFRIAVTDSAALSTDRDSWKRLRQRIVAQRQADQRMLAARVYTDLSIRHWASIPQYRLALECCGLLSFRFLR